MSTLWEDLDLHDRAEEVIAELREAGWAVVAITPQALEGTQRDWVENEMRVAAMREIGWFDVPEEGDGG